MSDRDFWKKLGVPKAGESPLIASLKAARATATTRGAASSLAEPAVGAAASSDREFWNQVDAPQPAAKKRAARKSTAKKTAARKPTRKKTAAKKTAAKKTAAKKTAAKKAAARKATPKKSRSAGPAAAAPSLETILAFLDREQVRCTYGAVADVLGVSNIAVPRLLGEPRPEVSWVVSKSTGEPTGFTDAQKHPELHRRKRIIDTGAKLRRALRG